MGNGDFPGYYQRGLSLLHGWLPLTVQIVVALVVLAAIGWRARRWFLIWLPVSVLIGLGVMFGVMTYFTNQGVLTDPAPSLLWVWITVTAAMIVVVVVGWRGIGWWRRGLSVLAVPLSLVCVGLVLNQWVGYMPTVQEAWSEATAGPLPDQVAPSALASLQGKGATMTNGRVVGVTIPDTTSHFVHREEYVYLPPVWSTGNKHPALPVIMMIPGEYNTAADWMRTGSAQAVMDHYAQQHHGYAPIMVFVDPGGTFNNDTECVNGPRGNVATHLTAEVRPYVISHYAASANPENWGVVGWSMGGTCAEDLALMHPDLFSTFESIAGDLAPNSGDQQQTIQRLFGGNAAAYNAFAPLNVLAHHGPYADTAGWYDDSNGIGAKPPKWLHRPPPGNHHGHHGGGGDWGGNNNELAEAKQLCAAGLKYRVACTVQAQNGGHTWQFATTAFSDALPWMVQRLERTPGAAPPPLPSSST
jgi:S-formylglutathione hydrolase FrmB